jgi:hypothetical protein
VKSAAGGRRFKARWTKSADGSNHPSKGEAAWWDRMRLKARAGLIGALEGEPRFDIYIARDCPNCRANGIYVGFAKLDAAFDDEQGRRRYQDYKGREGETPLSKLKRKIVEARFGINVELVGEDADKAARAKRLDELRTAVGK